MQTYFSTFTSGCSEIIESQLMRDIDDVKIIKLVDGLVIYQTAVLAAQIERLRYFNNSFILLSHREFEKKQHI